MTKDAIPWSGLERRCVRKYGLRKSEKIVADQTSLKNCVLRCSTRTNTIESRDLVTDHSMIRSGLKVAQTLRPRTAAKPHAFESLTSIHPSVPCRSLYSSSHATRHTRNVAPTMCTSSMLRSTQSKQRRGLSWSSTNRTDANDAEKAVVYQSECVSPLYPAPSRLSRRRSVARIALTQGRTELISQSRPSSQNVSRGIRSLDGQSDRIFGRSD